MEERVLNINLIYIYPETIEINNEINLLRIVDKKFKESLVFYCIEEKNIYKVYVINTITGQVMHLIDYNGKNSLDNLIDNIKIIETDIKNLQGLDKIEKYILKVIKY